MSHEIFSFFGAKSDDPRTARRAAPRMERLEERRFMSVSAGESQWADPSAADAEAMQGASGYEFSLNHGARSGAARDAFRFVDPSKPAPTGGAASALMMDTLTEAEFSGAFSSSAVAPGTFTPRVKLWGAERIVPERAAAAENSGIATTHQHATASVPPPGQTKPAPDNGALRVLLVEDDDGARNALSVILRNRGWDVTAVGTLAEAKRNLASHPDVVILDLTLPDGDGESILQQIRAEGMPTRVAVTTGIEDGERLNRVKELHPDVILSKPLNLNTLLQNVSPDSARRAA